MTEQEIDRRELPLTAPLSDRGKALIFGVCFCGAVWGGVIAWLVNVL